MAGLTLGGGYGGLIGRHGLVVDNLLAADVVLADGGGVVADATFIRRADREMLAAVAARHGCPVLFLECEAHPEVIRRRLDARREGPSDARWPTYLRQRMERDPLGPDEPHRTVETGGDLTSAVDSILPVLWHWRAPPGGER